MVKRSRRPARPGGVAEIDAQPCLGYFLDAGVATRWLVLDADEQFFAITKHLHNAIHGLGHGDFTKKDHKHYEKVLAATPSRTSSAPATSSCCMTRRPRAYRAGPR